MDELTKLKAYIELKMKKYEYDNSCCGNLAYGLLWDLEVEIEEIEVSLNGHE